MDAVRLFVEVMHASSKRFAGAQVNRSYFRPPRIILVCWVVVFEQVDPVADDRQRAEVRPDPPQPLARRSVKSEHVWARGERVVAEFQKNYTAACAEDGVVRVVGQPGSADAPTLPARSQLVGEEPLADDDGKEVLVDGERLDTFRCVVEVPPAHPARPGVETLHRPSTGDDDETARADLEPYPFADAERPELPTCFHLNRVKLTPLNVEKSLRVAQHVGVRKGATPGRPGFPAERAAQVQPPARRGGGHVGLV
jgi:hypothetical protein